MFYFHKSEIIATVMQWGIQQNPFTDRLPRKSDVIMQKLNSFFPNVIVEVEDICSFVSGLIDNVPEIREWNLSQFEYEHHVTVDDPNRAPYAFTSSYTTIKPEHDFIDLDALKRNVTRSLRQVQEERDS